MNGGAPDTGPGHVLGGWGSGLNFNWEGIYGLNIPNYIVIDELDISLPLGYSFYLPDEGSGAVIPPLGSTTTMGDQGTAPPEIDRRDVPEEEIESVPELETLSDEAWHAIMFPGVPWLQPGTAPSLPTGIISAEEESDMGILGDIVGGIYDQIDTGWGGILPGGVEPFWSVTTNPQPGFGAPTTAPQQPVIIQQGGGVMPPGPPPTTYAGGSCAPDDPYKGLVWKRVCGQWKWVKKKSRRRKQLFTDRDARQLSSLIGIAGKSSEVTKVWIASHPS